MRLAHFSGSFAGGGKARGLRNYGVNWPRGGAATPPGSRLQIESFAPGWTSPGAQLMLNAAGETRSRGERSPAFPTFPRNSPTIPRRYSEGGGDEPWCDCSPSPADALPAQRQGPLSGPCPTPAHLARCSTGSPSNVHRSAGSHRWVVGYATRSALRSYTPRPSSTPLSISPQERRTSRKAMSLSRERGMATAYPNI
jgi:hypothetical protein